MKREKTKPAAPAKDRSESAVKEPGRVWPYLVEAAIEAALALILFIWKDDGAVILRLLLGGVLALTGLVNILRYVSGHFTDFGLELLGGTVLLGLGLSFIIRSEDYGSLFMVILILLIVTDSLVDVRRAFLLKEHEFTFWYLLLFCSLAAVVLSVLLYFFPDMFGDNILTVIGIILIYEAVSTIFTTMCFSVIRKREIRLQKAVNRGPEKPDTPEEPVLAGHPPVPEGFDDTAELIEP